MDNLERKLIFFEGLDYKPTASALKIHADEEHRVIQLAGGVRFGKSLTVSKEGVYRIATHLEEGGRYWLVAADYARTGPEWEYMISDFHRMGLLRNRAKWSPLKSCEMLIGLPGWRDEQCIRIQTFSANDPVKLAGYAPKGIIVCEASQVDYLTFTKCFERLLETNGWLLMSGTFETSLGWYAEKFKYWQGENPENAKSYSCPSWENNVIFPGGRNDPKIKDLEARMSREQFMERCGGEPCPPAGAVVEGYFSNGVHVSAKEAYFDRNDDVYIAVDPGFTHSAAIEIIQVRNDTICVIDEIYQRGLVTSDLAALFNDPINKWRDNVRWGVSDIAGKVHRVEGAPFVDQWRKLTGLTLRYNKVPEGEGIEMLRRFLKPNPVTNTPRVYVNPKCTGLISEWGGCVNPISHQPEVWRYKTGDMGETLGDKPIPLHDDASKALIYFAWEYFGYAERKGKRGRSHAPISYMARR